MKIPREALQQVRGLYDRGLFLQAHALASGYGSLRKWNGSDARLLAGRLARQLGALRVATALHLLAGRESPASPEAMSYYTQAVLGFRGPLAAWEILSTHSPRQTEGHVSWAHWLTVHATVLEQLRDFDAAEHWLAEAEKTAPDDPRIVMTTIVSSRLLKKMARGFGVHFRETLTGFKWIANMAIDLRETKGYTFVFGFEEALGYTIGETVRDKDGIGAALAFADLAAHCRSQNQTVMDRLETIYRRFGFHLSGQRGVILPGSSGMAARERIMHVLRSNLPTGIGGVAVNSISDFKTGIQTDLISGQQTRIDLPQSDVLGLELEDASRILVRPSGTEPKIKYYFEVSNSLGQEDTLAGCETAAHTRLRDLAEAFLGLVEDRLDQPDPEEGSG